MNIKNAKLLSLIISLLLIFNSKAISSIITYKEILDKPTDLELNLNYAKQQEKSGNIKSTIATLERLSILYPKNADIKLYLLSILLKMDSKVKVDLMVSTMLNDPNTSDETKKLIAELLTDEKFEEEKPKKWFAYMDFTYSGTEKEYSPLNETLERYKKFFKLFDSFHGYVDFFLLQDLVTNDYSSIRYLIPFESFENYPLPNDIEEYKQYKYNLSNFVLARSQRIENLYK